MTVSKCARRGVSAVCASGRAGVGVTGVEGLPQGIEGLWLVQTAETVVEPRVVEVLQKFQVERRWTPRAGNVWVP